MSSPEWSVHFIFRIASVGKEYKFQGKALLLDPQSVKSVRSAVQLLNQGISGSREDCVIVLSEHSRSYYLLYRRGKKEAALAKFGMRKKDSPLAELGAHEKLLSELMTTQRKELKRVLAKAFADVVGGSKQINLDQAKRVRAVVLASLRLPDAAITTNDFETTYERFDFNGNGLLDKNEMYSLVKWSLYDYMKQVGITPTVDIPRKSLQQKGLRVDVELGRGGQAVVKRAFDKKGKEWCLKRYDVSQGAVQLGVIAGLKEEFEIMRRLACKNIGQVHDIFRDGVFIYTVSEVNKGGNFKTLTQRARLQLPYLDEKWWRDLFWQCFTALDFMHQLAIMHCDIKEENLMLKTENCHSPHVMLIDFGVSNAMTSKGTGQVSGTPGYIPPETYTTRKWFPVGDVFSMGVVMLQMVASQIQQVGIFIDGCRSIAEIIEATKRREPPVGMVQLTGLRQLCAKSLSKERRYRPRTHQVLRDAWFSGHHTPPKMERMKPSHPMATSPQIETIDKHTPIRRMRAPVTSATPGALTGDSKFREIVNCPSGHSFAEFQTEMLGFTCDVCGSVVIPEGATMFGCRLCNFDVCPKCVDDEAGVMDRALKAFHESHRNGDQVLTWSTGEIPQFINLLMERFGLGACSEDEGLRIYESFDTNFSQELSKKESVRLAHMILMQANANQDP